jgi:hypothetical protein
MCWQKQIEQSSKKINKIASHLKLATDSAKLVLVVRPYLIKIEWSNIHKKCGDMTKVVKT